MKIVKKIIGNIIKAYCLGEESDELSRLIEEGIVVHEDGKWIIFSQEATEGEVAMDGDFIKIDSAGQPYPNKREFFLENHRPLGKNEYEQIPKPLMAWDREEEMCPEIEYLIEKRGLVINENSEDERYSAPLWGDILVARADCVIVFYSVTIDENGDVSDIDFNFVARDEFGAAYEVIG